MKLPAMDELGPRNDSAKTTGEIGHRKTRSKHSLYVRPAGNGLSISFIVHALLFLLMGLMFVKLYDFL